MMIYVCQKIDDLTNLIGQICLFQSKISEKTNA